LGYWVKKKCPHCQTALTGWERWGTGDTFGDPRGICFNCSKPYKTGVSEWEWMNFWQRSGLILKNSILTLIGAPILGVIAAGILSEIFDLNPDNLERNSLIIAFLFALSSVGAFYLEVQESKKRTQGNRSKDTSQNQWNRQKSNNYSAPNINVFSSMFLPTTVPFLASMLGKLAACDGSVSKEELSIIETFFIQTLQLSKGEMDIANRAFNQGKDAKSSFESSTRLFYSSEKENKEILIGVADLLTEVALADGILSSEEEILLNEAFSIFQVESIKYKKYKQTQARYRPKDNERSKYYAKILGLSGKHLDKNSIKISYRRLARQYHPDKVSHLGKHIIEVAESEMKNINQAYEYFKNEYKF
jgi:DnaJ like chaperone protein